MNGCSEDLSIESNSHVDLFRRLVHRVLSIGVHLLVLRLVLRSRTPLCLHRFFKDHCNLPELRLWADPLASIIARSRFDGRRSFGRSAAGLGRRRLSGGKLGLGDRGMRTPSVLWLRRDFRRGGRSAVGFDGNVGIESRRLSKRSGKDQTISGASNVRDQRVPATHFVV